MELEILGYNACINSVHNVMVMRILERLLLFLDLYIPSIVSTRGVML